MNLEQIADKLIQKYSQGSDPPEKIQISKLQQDFSSIEEELSPQDKEKIIILLEQKGYKVKNSELLKNTIGGNGKSSTPPSKLGSYLGSSFYLFLQELEEYPPLSKEEEQQLLKSVAQGSQQAKEKIILHNIRLVINIAKGYRNKGLPFEDLVEEGILGLMKAIEKFDHTKGYKLSTYATWWIKQKISRALTDKGRMIRLPAHISETLSELKKTIYYFRLEKGRSPSRSELAENLDMSREEVAEYLKYLSLYDQKFTSLEISIGEEENTLLKEIIPDEKTNIEQSVLNRALKRDLNLILEELTPRQQEIIKLRYGLEDGRARTLQEIGDLFDLTRERIRQVEKKALEKLKHPQYRKTVEDYLTVT